MKDHTEVTDQTEVPVKEKPIRGRGRVLSNLTDIPSDLADEREAALDKVDRDAIDNIVLSSDVSKGGKIRVTRKGPLDHTYQYITTIPADSWNSEASFEYLKKLYGGGDYKCMTFRANGQLYKPFEFSIDYRCKGQLDEDDIKRLAAEQAGGRSSSNSDMLKMFELMRSDKPREDGLKSSDLIKLMEMSSQKSDQMMVMMMTMMTESSKNMMGLMTAMMAGQGNKPSIDPVVLELLKAKTEKTPITEVLETMKAIKELTAGDQKETEEKPFWEKLLTTAAPAVLGTMFGQPQSAQPPVPQPPQVTAPASSEQIDQPTADMLNNYMVRIFLNKVLVAAIENKDPALYADMIIETLSSEQLQMLRGVLTQSDWTVKLFGTDQRVAGCLDWLNELKQLLLSDELPPEQSGPTAGGGDKLSS
jgi:hypothetical protein